MKWDKSKRFVSIFLNSSHLDTDFSLLKERKGSEIREKTATSWSV